ncbi:MAG: hypothetical protein M3Z04_11125 [Chloroflexota bacterium]|nr:hypothetical protein [Chloroflexota bacterium]
MADNEMIGIQELISQVKRELLATHDDQHPLFVVGSVELQISFTAERNANGGVDLKIIQAGTSAKTIDVQSVRVTLQPIINLDEVRKGLSDAQVDTARQAVTRGESEAVQSAALTSRSG